MQYNMTADILVSTLAFLGLASMVFCYWDGVTSKMDYFLFSVIFFIFGYYCNFLFGEQYKLFPVYGGIAYMVGVIITLILNKKYRAWRNKKHQNQTAQNTTPNLE